MSTKTHSNHYFEQLAKKKIDYSADTFKAILMKTTFTYDPDTDDTYSDVSSDELATGNGYTAGGQALTGVTVTRNNTLNSCEIRWDDATWTASGGSITHGGAIIFDDTTTDDTIIYHISSGTITVGSGASYSLDNVGVDIKQGT